MKTTQILFLSVVSLLMLAGCNNKKESSTEIANAQEQVTVEYQSNENSDEGEEAECHDEFIKTIDLGGAPYRFTALGLACRTGDLSQVQTLIENGACISDCMEDDIFQYNALYAAVWFANTNIVSYLIQQGENVNRIYGEAGGTLLSLACLNEDKTAAFKIAELLIKAGASVQANTNFDGGYTCVPLHFAIEKDNLPLVKLLVEHGADIHIESEGMTVFQMADMSNDAEMKEYIRSLN